MNSREANELAEVLRQIEHGPGDGWRALLEAGAGGEHGHDGKGLELRLADFALWRDTWIRGPLQAVVARYMRKGRRGSLGTPGASKSAARFRAQLLEGDAGQARGVESAAFWLGYFRGVAMSAIERVEELEAAEARR